MKKTAKTLVALALALNLVACGGGTAPSGGSSSAPCEHQWNPATYTAPEVCALCGESQGEPKPNYFEENNLPIYQTLPEEALPVTFVTYADADPSIFSTHTGGTAVMSQSVRPADREGYKEVTLNVDLFLPIVGDESTWSAWNHNWSNALYDLYTGRDIPGRDLLGGGDDSFDYQSEVSYDGATYELYYSKANQADYSDWYWDANDTLRCDVNFHQTYIFLVPQEYDGLVYALVPSPVVPEFSDEFDEEEDYALELDYLEGTHFVRFGQENPNAPQEEVTAPEGESSPETPASQPESAPSEGTSQPAGGEETAKSWVNITSIEPKTAKAGEETTFTVTLDYAIDGPSGRGDIFADNGEEKGILHLVEDGLFEGPAIDFPHSSGSLTYTFTTVPKDWGDGSPLTVEVVLYHTQGDAVDPLGRSQVSIPLE